MSKRKACDLLKPQTSMKEFLSTALHTNFENFKEQIKSDFLSDTHAERVSVDDLVEELFRFLFVLCDLEFINTLIIYPSALVEKCFCSLLLDPILYYQICHQLLEMRGINNEMLPVRALPHYQLVTADENTKSNLYHKCLVEYSKHFEFKANSQRIWPRNKLFNKEDRNKLDGVNQIVEGQSKKSKIEVFI